MQYTELEKKIRNYVVFIQKGEKINAKIEEFCQSRNIIHASYTGIGAVTNVALALYNPLEKNYSRKTFESAYELSSLIGNYSLIKNNTTEDKFFAHTHVTISDDSFVCLGGHLDEAEVLAVTEIYIQAYNEELTRNFDEHIGLNVMNLACKL